MKAFRAGQAADIHVFARAVEGSGCERRAEIAGWYEMSLGPGQACLGEAAVKALLDAAATKVCCETLECPKDCPCNYTPQKKLGKYECNPGVSERGYLLQGTNVWNCNCVPKDID